MCRIVFCPSSFKTQFHQTFENPVFSDSSRILCHLRVMAPTRKLLFMSNREHGVANVQLAVSYEILTQYPDVEIHFVSFPGLQKHVEAVSSRATRTLTPTARVSPIIFHALPGSSITETVAARFGTSFQQTMTHPPGFAGAIESYKRATEFAASWPAEEHLKIYAAAASVIQEVDPALVVLDQIFIPGIEACKNLKVKRLVLSPNAAKDVLVQQQPRGEIFWKYPA
jgi:hypothetical protein